jgi:alkyl hydroperoxide reductase subunit AhpC
MSRPLAINEDAPDFEAMTTEGPIRFHEWLGDSWGILFSHPKDFTPVCTTELGTMAKLKPEFDKRNTKIIGLSVDPVDAHLRWAKDIEDTMGAAPNYPMIGDTDLKVAKLYGMLPADAGDSCEGRTAADNATVRNVYVIGPDKKIKLVLSYPMTAGAMITSSPGFQFAGVVSLCFAVSWSESMTRRISSKLRPAVMGYDRTSLIFLSGPMT